MRMVIICSSIIWLFLLLIHHITIRNGQCHELSCVCVCVFFSHFGQYWLDTMALWILLVLVDHLVTLWSAALVMKVFVFVSSLTNPYSSFLWAYFGVILYCLYCTRGLSHVSDVRHCDVIVFRHFLSVTFVVAKWFSVLSTIRSM
jgi:hypothetical protein